MNTCRRSLIKDLINLLIEGEKLELDLQREVAYTRLRSLELSDASILQEIEEIEDINKVLGR